MKQFSFKARTQEGTTTKGLIEAENEQSASALLINKGIVPVDITEGSKSLGNFDFFNKVTKKNKIFFVRQLATMTDAGLPIAQALTTLKEQTSKAPVKKMIDQMTHDIESGVSMSSAFSGFPDVFSKTDISMIASGEASGKMDEVLINLADQGEKNYKTMQKIKMTFIYPGFLAFVVVLVVWGLITFILPQMEDLYKGFGTVLPLPTRMLVATSHFLARYFLIVAIGVVALYIGIRIYIRTNKSGEYIWHHLKLKIPLFGRLLRLSYMSLFTRTLSSLVSSGVPILDSLEIVADAISNVIYSDSIMKVREKVKQGKNLSESLKADETFPVLVSQMVAVGESTGELDHMLKNMADYYDNELDAMTKSLQALLEPVLIVVMGGIVAIIIVCILLPIYSLQNFAGK